MNVQRFDHLLHDALAGHTAMVRHFNAAARSIQLFRRSAYRFAVAVLAIQKNYHNEFLGFARTNNLSIDQWLDQHFDPIEQMGDDRRNLFRCIEDGMTERQYVAHFTMWGVNKRAAPKDRVAHVDTKAATTVTSNMTDAQRADHFKKLYEAVAGELTHVRRDLVEKTRDIARMLSEFEKLKKQYARIERLVWDRKKKTA